MSFYQNNNSSYTNFPQPVQTRPTSTPPASVSAGGPVPSRGPATAAAATADEYPPGAMSYINLNIEEYRIRSSSSICTGRSFAPYDIHVPYF